MKPIELNIDIGIQTFNINGIGEVKFQPNDPEIIVRFEEIQKNIKGKLKSVDNNPSAEELKDVIQYIKEQMNYLFNYDVSEILFKHCSPLAVGNNGCYVLYNIFESLSPYMGNKYEKAEQTTMNRAERRSYEKRKKYIGKYGIK